jgi:hypothetical protein
MNRTSIVSVTLGALFLLQAATVVKAGVLVPFRGTLDAGVTHADGGPNTDLVTLTGTGQATQLGQFSFSAPHSVNTMTRTATGSFEFTAANGDTLSATFTGIAMPTATPGVISIVETATITGGTGRFSGAIGSFTVSRLYDRNIEMTSGSFSGTISSPGALSP